MKKTLLLTFIILSSVPGFSKGFILKGFIEGLQLGTVLLSYVNQSGIDTTLTAPIQAGAFTFLGEVQEPDLAKLSLAGGWSYNISFFLENAEINVIMVKDAPQKTTITGSVSEVTYEKLKPGLYAFFEQARQNKAAQASLPHNSAALQSADSLWNAQQHQWIQNIRSAVSAKSENYAALYFIRWLLFKPDNFDTILSVFNQLSPVVRLGQAGKKLLADFEHLHRTLPGQPAPEISGNDTSGNAIKLAAFKGKVVLLDFWASYCGPCRQENRNMLPIYQKYHPKGFEIISLSLDNERPLWLNAIKADGMVWPQVSELRGGAGATGGIYDITDLPRNVLINKDGSIYARDLHGDELIHAVESLLLNGK